MLYGGSGEDPLTEHLADLRQAERERQHQGTHVLRTKAACVHVCVGIAVSKVTS